MRAVLDTNILCSALLTPGGPTDRLYQLWREGRRVTRYPRLRPFIESAAAGAMHNRLRRLAVLVVDLPFVDASKDPADNFLAIAQAGNADVLVTGDKHDPLALKSFERTRIVTARQFLRMLGDKKKRTPKRKAPATRGRKRKTSL